MVFSTAPSEKRGCQNIRGWRTAVLLVLQCCLLACSTSPQQPAAPITVGATSTNLPADDVTPTRESPESKTAYEEETALLTFAAVGDMMLGTAIGLVPGITALVLAGDTALRYWDTARPWILGGIALLICIRVAKGLRARHAARSNQ